MGSLDIFELLLVGLTISLDNFAAALAIGARGGRTPAARVLAFFTFFGILSPSAGVAVGQWLAGPTRQYAEWAGVAVLGGLGVWTLVSAVGKRENESFPIGSPLALAVLSASISLDNLAVGFGVGLHGADWWLVGLVSGVFVFCATGIGLRAGRAGHRRWGRWSAVAAGVLLIVLALFLAQGWI
jgi:putative Mn2+ efflux pump MntP